MGFIRCGAFNITYSIIKRWVLDLEVNKHDSTRLGRREGKQIKSALQNLYKVLIKEYGLRGPSYHIVDLKGKMGFEDCIAILSGDYICLFTLKDGKYVSEGVDEVNEALNEVLQVLNNFRLPVTLLSFDVNQGKMFSEVIIKDSIVPGEYVLRLTKI